MGDVVVVVVIVVVLVVGAALVARVTGRGRPGGRAGARPGGAPRGGRPDQAPSRRGAGGTTGSGAVSGGVGRAAGGRGGVGGRSAEAARPPQGPPAFLPGGDRRVPPTPGGPDTDEGRATDPGAPAQEGIGPAVQRPEAAPAASLPELLAGVDWPCGLEPATGPGQPDGERYQALTTTGVAPDDVGAAIGDELERLGYRLHSLSDDEVVARRGEELLSLRLHPEAAEAEVAGRPLFPEAEPGTVGIELWVGAGPSPRTT